jgi:hypothetical protein
MTMRPFLSNVARRFGACCLAAVALALSGCAAETIPPSPEIRAVQHQSALHGVDQAAKTKSGKKRGPSIVTKSVKGLIKKVEQP